MENKFLQEILGSEGAKALAKANTSSLLQSVIAPRAIIAWLSTMGNFGFEGDLPGCSDSYLSLVKNEDGTFSGALTIDKELYVFEKHELLHVAASVGIALGHEPVPLIDDLKTKDLSKLGKTIDLLVKAEIVRKAKEELKPIVFGDFIVEKEALSKSYSIKHSSGKFFSKKIEDLETAKKAAEWFDKKAKTKLKKASPGGFGNAAAPRPPAAPTIPMKQAPLGKTVNITKSESLKLCSDCGQQQFKQNKFKGCFCLADLAKSVKIKTIDNGFQLRFSPKLDADSVATIISVFKD